MIIENIVFKVETMDKRIYTEYGVFRKYFSSSPPKKKKGKKIFLLFWSKAELLLRIIICL